MPRLLELGETLGAKFTFFVNMGRAFDRRITLSKLFRRLAKRRRGHSLSAASKLGLLESIRAAVLNPYAGRAYPSILRAAANAGHEIGLHGGRNHATWERSGHLWSEDDLGRELEVGLRWMAEGGLPRPTSFASPAWNSPPGLGKALRALGFDVIADTYGADEEVNSIDGLLSMPTNITAEQGNAGYLETAFTRGWSRAEITTDFARQLSSKHELAVVYDHPFFAGIHALEWIGGLIQVALDHGFSVCTVHTAARHLRHEHALMQTTPR